MLPQPHLGRVDRFGNVTSDAAVSKFTSGQIAQRSTWTGVGESEIATMAMHTIRCVPNGASTITIVGSLDPGTADGSGWVDIPVGVPGDTKHRRAQ